MLPASGLRVCDFMTGAVDTYTWMKWDYFSAHKFSCTIAGKCNRKNIIETGSRGGLWIRGLY